MENRMINKDVTLGIKTDGLKRGATLLGCHGIDKCLPKWKVSFVKQLLNLSCYMVWMLGHESTTYPLDECCRDAILR